MAGVKVDTRPEGSALLQGMYMAELARAQQYAIVMEAAQGIKWSFSTGAHPCYKGVILYRINILTEETNHEVPTVPENTPQG